VDTYSHSICNSMVSHLRKYLTLPVYTVAHIKATPGHNLKKQNLCQGTVNHIMHIYLDLFSTYTAD
jgi:hypothetical protein